MLIAEYNGIKSKVTAKAQTGKCLDCGEEVRSVFGEKVIKHWRHKPGGCSNPDTWKNGGSGETEWHSRMKELAEKYCQENNIFYEIEKRFDKLDEEGHTHRTDFYANGICFEFQNSPIDPHTISIREDYYGKVVWLFNYEGMSFHCNRPIYYIKDNNLYSPLGRIYSESDSPKSFDAIKDKKKLLKEIEDIESDPELKWLVEDICEDLKLIFESDDESMLEDQFIIYKMFSDLFERYEEYQEIINVNNMHEKILVINKRIEDIDSKISKLENYINQVEILKIEEKALQIKKNDEISKWEPSEKLNNANLLFNRLINEIKNEKKSKYYQLTNITLDEDMLLHICSNDPKWKIILEKKEKLSEIMHQEKKQYSDMINNILNKERHEIIEKRREEYKLSIAKLQEERNILIKEKEKIV